MGKYSFPTPRRDTEISDPKTRQVSSCRAPVCRVQCSSAASRGLDLGGVLLLGAFGGVAFSTSEGGRSVKRETGVEDPTGGTGVGTRADSSRRLREPGVDGFTVPSLPEGLHQRSRLLERLDVGVDGPLTLVSAPAGSGKSVLVAAWASGAQARCPVAWVTLEANEQSRSGFWPSLARGLHAKRDPQRTLRRITRDANRLDYTVQFDPIQAA